MRPVLLGLVAVMLAAACGNGVASIDAPPPMVAEGLVPSDLRGDLEVRLYEGDEGKEAFASAGEKALVADGRIWEIRQGTTLVGVLQISTVKQRVDLSEDSQREAITSILAGGLKRVEIEGVPVTLSETEDQVRYLWFGADFFELLTLKSSRFDPEAVLRDLLSFQVRRPEWKPLPEAEEDA